MRLFIALLLASFAASADIHRDPKQKYAFKKLHPCPVTKRSTGSCPGFVVDHINPLCAGGLDNPGNMQWQSYNDSLVKDKWEKQLCRGLKK